MKSPLISKLVFDSLDTPLDKTDVQKRTYWIWSPECKLYVLNSQTSVECISWYIWTAPTTWLEKTWWKFAESFRLNNLPQHLLTMWLKGECVADYELQLLPWSFVPVWWSHVVNNEQIIHSRLHLKSVRKIKFQFQKRLAKYQRSNSFR